MRAEVEAYGYRSDGAPTEPTADTADTLQDAPTTPTTPDEHPIAAENEERPMTADELIATLTTQRQGLLDALTDLTDEQLDTKGTVGDWSIKNALAHLTAWEQVVTQITPERLRTGVYPEALRAINADEDADNARETAAREHLTPTEQLAEFAQARADLATMIHSLGDDALAREHPWPEWDPPLTIYSSNMSAATRPSTPKRFAPAPPPPPRPKHLRLTPSLTTVGASGGGVPPGGFARPSLQPESHHPHPPPIRARICRSVGIPLAPGAATTNDAAACA